MVFAGGGVKALGVIGALQTLRDVGGYDFGAGNPPIQDVAGVSIGSVFALMIALKYSVAEITECGSKLTTSDTINATPIILLLGGLSIDDGTLLGKFVDSIFAKKNISKNITFEELYKITNIQLHVVVTNLTKGEVEHISAKSHPDSIVQQAIVASMSLPLIYPPVISKNGDIWIDGGILDNFPVMMFNPQTLLGFDFLQKAIQNTKIDSLFSYISRVLQVKQIPNDIISWKLMSKEHKKRIILIDTGNTEVFPTYDLTKEQRNILISAGSRAAKQKLDEMENNAIYVEPEMHNSNIKLPTYMKSLQTTKK